MDFHTAVEIILEHEGGLVDDPRDPGGLTNYGISQRAYPLVDIRALTPEQAAAIYREDYWQRMRCDDLPLQLRLPVFDMAVNMGRSRSGKILQQALNDCGASLVVDGALGPKSITATTVCDRHAVLDSMGARRALFYAGLSTFDRFGRGWLKRTFNVHRRA